MNYNQLAFWLLFLTVIIPYWRLGHRGQNRLLLVASYVFYGFWDYRFLFLILISTVIDFVGGLGVAGVRLERGRMAKLGALIVLSALVLCSNVEYRLLFAGDIRGAMPHRIADFAIAGGTLLVVLLYGFAIPALYRLPERKRRTTFLVISMVANLGILGFFKYWDFFVDSLSTIAHQLGIPGVLPVISVVLPAGISFYTFQAMSYTIDIWRGKCEPTRDFADFALFVCFFPHLVAGPIMRAHTLLPQVLKPRSVRAAEISEGAWLVLVGLFKKMVLSDNVAPFANSVFSRLADGNTAGLTGSEVLVGIYAFALQIYGDFSGYSSIARGISKWLGFELVINFRQPYLATTPSDFWRRWHISLSTWLRDYLYIPLGGNRHGVRREYVNLILTMLLGGLWHGASWTFVAWGLYHGVILSVFRAAGIRDALPSEGRVRYLVRLFVMFHLTCLGWLLFRADNFSAVARAIGLIFSRFEPSMFALTPLLLIGFYGGVLLAVEHWTEGEERLDRAMGAPWLARAAICSFFVGMLILFRAGKAVEFIYFQF